MTIDGLFRKLGRHATICCADLPKKFELRKQNHVQLVVGKERLTLEGELTTWEELRNRLEVLADRKNTILYIARTTDDWIISEWQELEDRILVTCRDLGIESTSFVGQRPLGYRATRSRRLVIAGKSQGHRPDHSTLEPRLSSPPAYWPSPRSTSYRRTTTRCLSGASWVTRKLGKVPQAARRAFPRMW